MSEEMLDLTAAEREELIEALQMPTMWRDKGLPTENVLYQTNDGGLAEELVDDRLLPVISRILADRVQALTAERDDFEANCAHWMKSYEQQTEFARQMAGERNAARAELAAANTRCAELEGERQTFSGQTAQELMVSAAAHRRQAVEAQAELADHAKLHKDMVTQAEVMDKHIINAEAEIDELQAQVDVHWRELLSIQAERDLLRARIDKALALADEWDERAEARQTHKTHREWTGGDGERLSGYVSDNPRNDAEGSVFDTCSTRLRAALTPEGKP